MMRGINSQRVTRWLPPARVFKLTVCTPLATLTTGREGLQTAKAAKTGDLNPVAV
jgi:hypothetical protein